MALSSMTGFARSHGASGPYAFEWELKSVNAKGFDLRMRLPPGWDELEAFAKKRAGEMLVAGNGVCQFGCEALECGLHDPHQRRRAGLDREGCRRACRQDRCGGAQHRWPAVAIKGMIEVVEPESDEVEDKAATGRRGRLRSNRRSPIWSRCASAKARRSGKSCSQRMDKIEKLAKKAEAAPGRKPEAIRARLAK